MENQSEKNATEAFEKALFPKETRDYLLRLYIAGTTPQSINALKTIKAICEEYLKGHYELEVIDVYQQPSLAKPDNIVALPTLIKKLPLPLQRIIGDLSKTEKILIGLDILPK